MIRALLAGHTAAAEALLGARMPEDVPDLSDLFRLRLDQLEEAPEDEPWLTRAIVLKLESRVIGVTGFHGRPGGAWLRDYAPAGLEFGYTIFEGCRRRGYAAEAGEALIQWAKKAHGVQSFVLSMAPRNDGSLGVARKLGFQEAGEWVHPQRGREIVYLRTTDRTSSSVGLK